MENSSVSDHTHSEEDFIKNRNLLLNMDYDSGYISHNPESNLDSSSESAENLKPSSSKPIYLSEDALLETPELCKYPEISLEIRKENFEETRNIFNSPILSSTTHVSASTGSICSQKINFSGFNSDESDTSLEIPYFNQIILDNKSVENTQNSLYNSDLQDLKREGFKNLQNKNSAFNNITNTVANNEQIKKLTLIFSKSDKENIYSVKRKYCSLSPPSDKNSNNENSILMEYAEKLFQYVPEESKNECFKCTNCNSDISKEYTSFDKTFSSTCNESSVSDYVAENKYINVEKNIFANHDEIKIEESEITKCDGIKVEENEITKCNEIKVEETKFNECKIAEKECNEIKIEETEINNCKVEEIVPVDDSTELMKPGHSSAFESALSGVIDNILDEFKNKQERLHSLTTSNQELDIHSKLPNIDNDLIQKCRQKIILENTSKDEINKTSLSVVKSIVSETLQDMLKKLQNSLGDKIIAHNIKESQSLSEETNHNIQNNLASTPEKSYENSNSFGLSPDLFEEDQIEEKVTNVSQPTPTNTKEKNVVKKDYMILRRAQNNLKGVIPPRSLTLIKLSFSEMLSKIESNKRYFWDSSTVSGCQKVQDSKSLLITSSMENCKNKKFPQVLKDRCLGLYHNRSKFSEEFEELCVKYGQRFVGAETQSSCTVFEINNASPIKRAKPQWNTKSPGKRLSHLARRRITFSSANLQSGSSFLAGSRARQILVDAKKLDLSKRRSPRKSPRKTPKKTPRKSPRIKTRTPSSSAKKKLAMRFRKVTGEIEKSSISSPFDVAPLSAKRTLFASPDDEKKMTRFLPSTSGASSIDKAFKRSASKRALFMSPSKSSPLKNMGFKRSPVKRLDFGLEKKRKRTDDDSSEELMAAKFPRCHSEIIPSRELDLRTLCNRARSELNLSQKRQIKELTTNHKKKLQLAIYEALRSQNILPTHAQFKTFASNLGRLTRKLFLMTTADSVGVTEKMLRIARHHVISVVKGKTPEEIYEEFMKQKLKNLKPQGYVAPNSNLEKPLSAREQQFGKTNSNENKIERIRKAINFGDDDNR